MMRIGRLFLTSLVPVVALTACSGASENASSDTAADTASEPVVRSFTAVKWSGSIVDGAGKSLTTHVTVFSTPVMRVPRAAGISPLRFPVQYEVVVTDGGGHEVNRKNDVASFQIEDFQIEPPIGSQPHLYQLTLDAPNAFPWQGTTLHVDLVIAGAALIRSQGDAYEARLQPGTLALGGSSPEDPIEFFPDNPGGFGPAFFNVQSDVRFVGAFTQNPITAIPATYAAVEAKPFFNNLFCSGPDSIDYRVTFKNPYVSPKSRVTLAYSWHESSLFPGAKPPFDGHHPAEIALDRTDVPGIWAGAFSRDNPTAPGGSGSFQLAESGLELVFKITTPDGAVHVENGTDWPRGRYLVDLRPLEAVCKYIGSSPPAFQPLPIGAVPLP
jgi:hypothetical protein